MKIIYRISDAGYNKVKPDYITNENCLKNFCSVFVENLWDIHIIADNVSKETYDMIVKYVDKGSITHVKVGHGAGTFNLALDEALKGDDDQIVYFVENDYLHLKHSAQIIKEGLDLGAGYVTLYLHPDKFISPLNGGNPEVGYDGGYPTKIYRGATELFGMFNSTTMTFASTVKNLKEDEEILRKWTNKGHYPDDYKMFLELREKGKALLCPLNTYATHGETAWLAPLYKVEKANLVEEWKKHLVG
jgi:hypothetical protein